jgi:hypothetical protein
VTEVEATAEQVAETIECVCYWIGRAEEDAYQGRFASPYGEGCAWNPSGQSRYDSEENVSIWRELHAQPPSMRKLSVEMMLEQVKDGHCMS